MIGHGGLRLLPFEASQLHLVEPWFDDPDTRRWLGGPGWPRQMLGLMGRPLGEYRGARETGRFRWLAWEHAAPVGYIDCGTYDRWTTWEGGDGGRGVVSVISVPSASISYVVDPKLRGRGRCARMIAALTSQPELALIRLFAAGVEPDNLPSIRCLVSAGFEPLDAEPDWERMIYYVKFVERTAPGSP
jgi:RimJ/RimL family protein N-acetyltransferase